MSEHFLIADKKFVPVSSARPLLWRHKDDVELHGVVRQAAITLNGAPQVFVFRDGRVNVTRDWQFFIRAINHNMTIQHVSAIYGHKKAFANGTGFGNEKDPRADYLKGENLTFIDPQFDKVRTCARSVMTGVIRGTELVVTMMDGNKPPPLKPGRSYPQRVADINVEDYLYTPRTHRHLFFAANIIKRKGHTVLFAHGGVYDWTGDSRPYTWLPHVSRFAVRYSLSKLTPVPDDAPIPSPYLIP